MKVNNFTSVVCFVNYNLYLCSLHMTKMMLDMKCRLLIIACMLSAASQLMGQEFRGHYLNQEYKIRFELNLDSAAIEVPGLPDDRCYGFLQGNLNGTWIVLKVINRKEGKATVRCACDNGSDGQTLELALKGDSILTMRQTGDANIKTIEGRKYVKLPKVVEFKK